MKKIILAVFVTMMMLSPAYADEEIQLAAVMVESGYSATDTNKMIYASLDNRASRSFRGGSRDSDFEYGIIAGIVVAVVLASTAENWDSTSNH